MGVYSSQHTGATHQVGHGQVRSDRLEVLKDRFPRQRLHLIDVLRKYPQAVLGVLLWAPREGGGDRGCIDKELNHMSVFHLLLTLSCP